jgi:exopolysaccharide production protein ExoZ
MAAKSITASDYVVNQVGSAVSARLGQMQTIQVLRAVAALMVVIHHSTRVAVDRVANVPSSIVWKTGEAGVDLFFVISGLVMGIAYYRGRSLDWKDFLRRRVTRIVPMYWIATTLKLLLLLIIPVAAVHSRISVWNTVASYLFIPARSTEGGIVPILGQGWTLNFEMLFYLLFTAALALRAKVLPFLGATIGALAFAGLWRSGNWPAALRCADPMLLEFLMGLWLASRIAKGLALSTLSCTILICVGAGCILAAPRDTDVSLFRVVFWGIPALAIVAGMAAATWRPRPWQTQLGDASYAIYLFHGFSMAAMGMLFSRIGFSYVALILWSFCGTLVSALLGLAIYRFMEKPMLKMINSWAKKRDSASAGEH